MKTISKIISTFAFTFFSIFALQISTEAQNFSSDIFPKLSEQPDIEMRYLSTEAYESAMGLQLVSAQTRALAAKCMGGITSLSTIYTASNSKAARIGMEEFEKFHRSHSDLKLLMRTKNNDEDRSIWLLPGSEKETPQMIIIVKTPSQYLFSVLTGKGTGAKDNSSYEFPFNMQGLDFEGIYPYLQGFGQ